MSEQVKMVVFVPESHADAVRQAMGDAGAGEIGRYTHCSVSSRVAGRFLPQEGARPAIGEVGRLETVEEERIEMICLKGLVNEVVKAIKEVHPYEEVALDIYALEPQAVELARDESENTGTNIKKDVGLWFHNMISFCDTERGYWRDSGVLNSITAVTIRIALGVAVTAGTIAFWVTPDYRLLLLEYKPSFVVSSIVVSIVSDILRLELVAYQAMLLGDAYAKHGNVLKERRFDGQVRRLLARTITRANRFLDWVDRLELISLISMGVAVAIFLSFLIHSL
jgi:hypothetical protein